MKIIAASLGAFLLNLALIAAGVLMVAAILWILIPVLVPGLAFSFGQGIALSGLLFLVKAIYS